MMVISKATAEGAGAKRALAESLRRYNGAFTPRMRKEMLSSGEIADALAAVGRRGKHNVPHVSDRLVNIVSQTRDPKSAEKVAKLLLAVDVDNPSGLASLFERLACSNNTVYGGSARSKAEVVATIADALSIFKHDPDLLMAILRTSI